MNTHAFSLCLAILASTLPAQSIVVPNGMANGNPGTTTLAWRNTLFRFQMIYDTSHFLDQGINYPITISRLRYRAGGGATSTGGETYPGVTVQMSSSPSDWNGASTTFATNRGTDNTTVFTGTVTCAAATGATPNNYIIDIPLTTPFVYDPMEGLDLCIEVDSPAAPIPTGVPTMAASSNVGHLARRVSTASANAATGTLSYFALVCMMDYTPVPNAATATKYGAGCVGKAQVFYETFAAGTLDLQGSPGAPNSILMTPLGSRYAVTPGSNAWYTPTTTALVLSDDQLTPPLGMPFTFNHPGGSTSSILACSNGYVFLDVTQTSTTASATPGQLVAEGARLAPLWNDLDPSAGGAVFFDVDPSNSAVYVTWDQVPVFNVPGSSNTLQLAIFNDGRIEYRYQVCQHGNGLVGWTPGGSPRDGGGIDISAAMPFLTEPDNYPLALEPTNRPRLGGNHRLEIRDIPSGATLGAMALGFTQHAPGIPLDLIGMAGCTQLASYDGTFAFVPSGTSLLVPLQIPMDTALAGLHVYGQAVSSGSVFTPLGLITSNGVDLLLDLN